MKRKNLFVSFGMGLVALSALGCSADKTQPQTLEQQRAMATGRAPTPEELQEAMSKLPKPPAGAPQVPPSGTTTP